jgi:secreted PhoX family phosphatase
MTFGYNCDYVAFLPIDLPDGGESSEDGLLVVNHEYPHAVLQHPDYRGGAKTDEQVRRERASLGVSIFRVKRRRGGVWECAPDPRARRVDGYTPCELTGPARGSKAIGGATCVEGTVGNCSGGVTPWGTVLSCEENVDDYPAAVSDKRATVGGRISPDLTLDGSSRSTRSTPRRRRASTRRWGDSGTRTSWCG